MSLLLACTLGMSLIIVFALAATVVLRKRSAAMRHWVLAFGIFCAAAVPLLQPIAPSWPSALGRLSFAAASFGLMSNTIAVSNADESSLSVRQPADNFLRSRAHSESTLNVDSRSRLAAMRAALPSPIQTIRAILVGGVVVNLCVLFAGLARLARLASHAQRLHRGHWIAMAREVSDEYGIRRPIRLLQGDHPSLLATWGHVRPTVLLPAAARSWSAHRMRIVLAHELAHIRRGDWVTQIAAELVRCVYWFNPLLWIACRRLRFESERACDDAALCAGVDGATYATHVLDLARAANARRRVSSPGLAMVGRSGFERRIDAMLNAHLDRRPLTQSSRLAIAIAFFAITLPVAGLGAVHQAATQFSGWIVDQSGAPVTNATILLTDTQTRTSRETATDPRGHFEYPELSAGDYSVEVKAAGFAPRIASVRIEPGQQIERNIRLQLGSVTETIVVSDSGTPGMDKEQTDTAAPSAGHAAGQPLQAPLLLKFVHPTYPERLRSAGVHGSVTLEGRIGVDGTLTNLEVVPPANPDLARAALDAVRQWRYEPTRLHGVPAETNISVTIDFVSAR